LIFFPTKPGKKNSARPGISDTEIEQGRLPGRPFFTCFVQDALGPVDRKPLVADHADLKAVVARLQVR
jgi:hypothetical protein